MPLVPLDKATGRKRPLNENERARKRQQDAKAAYRKRNGYPKR